MARSSSRSTAPQGDRVHSAVSLGVKLASAAAAICTVVAFAADWGITGGATRRSMGTFGATWIGITPAVDTVTALGDTIHMVANVTDKHGTAIVGVETKWVVDHPEIATVNQDGTLIARSPGSATILVTLGKLLARATIVVYPKSAFVHVASDSAITIAEGTAHAVSARATDARGHVIAGRPIHWHSADTTVVAIDTAGNLVGASAGHTAVTATIDGVSADAPVTVVPIPGALAVVAGDKQHASAGANLPQPVVVLVVSHRGRPLADQTIHFRRVDATGSADLGTAETDNSGRAHLAWRLSDLPGRQRLVATVDGLDSALTMLADAEPVAANTRAVALADSQQARVATALPQPVGLRLTDTTGRVLSDVSIAWIAPDGGTITNASPRTDSLGEARATWTLGPHAGSQHLRAEIGDGRSVRPVIVRATALPGPAAALAVVGKPTLKARAGAALPHPLAFRVTDANNNPVAGVQIRMTVTTGTLSDTTSQSDSTGIVRATWTLGPAAGPQHVTAHADGVTQSVTLAATATPAPITSHKHHAH
jgi:Bacterial Ig-like domain (group 1)/Bacterial Ig-like domain (group 2)